jgi:starch synthase
MNKVWLVAAENGAFRGGKIGGVGDVIRDLPIALIAAGLNVRVITPSYGMFHKLPGTTLYRRLTVGFAGKQFIVKIFKVPVAGHPVPHYVIEHALLSPSGAGRIYVSDEPGKPFAVDAAKFAFFSAVVAKWVNVSKSPPQVLHLNDWHTGLIAALKAFGNPDLPLAKVRTVFTIHNLAYQGIRPLLDDESSLENWFPELIPFADHLRDPRYLDCVNFMATAIRLADGINTVSPTYAREIQRSSDPATGFRGGEGLEQELREADRDGRLSGMLNGCMYPEKADRDHVPQWDDLLELIAQHAEIIHASQQAGHWIASRRGRRPRHLLLSIGRIVEQKVPLFLEPVAGFGSALEAILAEAGPDALFIMLGSGEAVLEERFAQLARSHDNFLFLRGYVESLSGPLYVGADLFLMPSSFEPCGISQMLAMRAGQPCVVHAVGGLKDTVRDFETGFVFAGDTVREQAQNFVNSVKAALAIRHQEPARWQNIRSNAAAQRFSWEVAASQYMQRLYRFD